MVFVMILIRINSSETGASGAAGVKCFFIYYLHVTTGTAELRYFLSSDVQKRLIKQFGQKTCNFL